MIMLKKKKKEGKENLDKSRKGVATKLTMKGCYRKNRKTRNKTDKVNSKENTHKERQS